MCSHCGTSDAHAYFGTRPIGLGQNCPSCGSIWSENEVIASSAGKSIPVILRDFGTDLKKGMLKVIWLAPQSGKP